MPAGSAIAGRVEKSGAGFNAKLLLHGIRVEGIPLPWGGTVLINLEAC